MLAVAADSHLGEATRPAAPRRSCAGPHPGPALIAGRYGPHRRRHGDPLPGRSRLRAGL